MPSWDEWREQGKRIRKHTVNHLDYYLGQLAESVRSKGGHIYFAQTAAEAREFIINICKEKNNFVSLQSKK